MLEIERGRRVKPQKLPVLEQRIYVKDVHQTLLMTKFIFELLALTSLHSELVYLPKANYSTVNLTRSQTTTNLCILCHLHIDH